MVTEKKPKKCRHKWVTRWAVFHRTSRGGSQVSDQCVRCEAFRTDTYRVPEQWEYDEEVRKRTCELCDEPHLNPHDYPFTQPPAPSTQCIVGLKRQIDSLRSDLDDLKSNLRQLGSDVRHSTWRG